MLRYSFLDNFTDYLCSCCQCANEDCLPGNNECVFKSDIWELEDICKHADEVANGLLKRADSYSREQEYEDSRLAYLGV